MSKIHEKCSFLVLVLSNTTRTRANHTFPTSVVMKYTVIFSYGLFHFIFPLWLNNLRG